MTQSIYSKDKHSLIEQPDENDFEKYPLPICFDPVEEQGKMWKRSQKIKAACRTIPCSSDFVGVEGKVYTEGVDYDVITAETFTHNEKYGYGCAMCCNGDRCDEDCKAPYKGRRKECPYCKGEGWFNEIPSIAFPIHVKMESKTSPIPQSGEDEEKLWDEIDTIVRKVLHGWFHSAAGTTEIIDKLKSKYKLTRKP